MKKLKAIASLYLGREFHGIDLGSDEL